MAGGCGTELQSETARRPARRSQPPVTRSRHHRGSATTQRVPPAMQPGALRALEFDRIVEAVKSFALTPMGAERLARLQPSTDPRQVAQLLAATTETARYIAAHGAVSAARVRATCRRSSPRWPSKGARSKRCACWRSPRFSTRSTNREPASAARRDRFRCSRRASGGAASFKSEIAQTREKIDPSGDVVDHASPELRMIRDRLRKQRARLRTTLESYLRGKDTAKYLQDQVVTERNGRYVLVVKAEHRSGIPGHRARRVDERRQPVPRAAQHGRNQQRHRRARGAGSRRSPPHPARADRRVPRARRRPARARSKRRPSSTCCRRARASRIGRRHRAGAVDRRRVRAAGGAASAARSTRCR